MPARRISCLLESSLSHYTVHLAMTVENIGCHKLIVHWGMQSNMVLFITSYSQIVTLFSSDQVQYWSVWVTKCYSNNGTSVTKQKKI